MKIHYRKKKKEFHYVVIQSVLAFREQGESVLQISNRMEIPESHIYRIMKEWKGVSVNEVKDEWKRRQTDRVS